MKTTPRSSALWQFMKIAARKMDYAFTDEEYDFWKAVYFSTWCQWADTLGK